MLVCLASLFGCFPTDPHQLERISAEQALEIAQIDAKEVYGDLIVFEATIDTVDTQWKIDFHSLDTAQVKEGPHYLVARRGGKIVMKYYPQ